ncbi:MAG: hypothetical protein M3442_21045 [Chloroflexota bacterium]|nr:hypothetical protein [Chloroflexota bacterium]
MGRTILVGAHRGAVRYAPENTLAAFDKAIELDTYRIECDVRRSRDGHLVLFHDATVDRMSDGAGRVCDLTLEELKRLRIGGAEFASTTSIATLAEAIEHVKGRCRLLVELKDDGTAADVVAEIERTDMVEACTISAFDEDMLVRAKELQPRLGTACFLTTPRPFDAQDVVSRLGISMLIVWPRAVVPEQIADAKRAGLHIRCGFPDTMTYDETFASFRRLADMGVDEMACGRPDWIAQMAQEYARNAPAS